MENKMNNLLKEQIRYRPKSIFDYFNIIREHLWTFLIIFIFISVVSVFYALNLKNTYTAKSTLRITPPEGNILDSPILSLSEGLGSSKADRFIANEIETMKNITIRKRVAQVILDSFRTKNIGDKLTLLLKKNSYFESNNDSLKSEKATAILLTKIVKISQKRGLDFIDISVSSPSPFESALIVNSYADVYKKFNLLNSRKQVTRVRKFLEEQKRKKKQDLLYAENKYKLYQLKGGAIQLDEQAKSLIETISDLESQINSTSIEAAISKEKLNQYKAQLKNKDASLSKFLDTKATQPYLLKLQNQIATLETQRDYAIAGNSHQKNNRNILSQYNSKIKSLKAKLKKSTGEYQASILAASPEEIKDLTQKIFEEEVKYNALTASDKKLTEHLQKYEKKFDALPERTIDLARLERERLSFEKLYITLEEKYQEALINEQSTSGNVLVLNTAEIPDLPSGPDRLKIILIGLSIGLFISLGYIIFRDSIDKSIKTPDEIEERNIELLGWLPMVGDLGKNGQSSEIVVAGSINQKADDAFKALRTMLKYSKIDVRTKSLLVTSSLPSEGKTFVAANLAGSFAQAKNKTLILDADLRKPRIHNLFNTKRYPGFTDYFTGIVAYEEIIRKTSIDGLFLITCGTIPPNPTEMLDSKGMKTFINRLKEEFDTIVIDSPPIATLADSLILSELVEKTILVSKSHLTEMEILEKSVKMLKKIDNSSFSGVLLNGFDIKKNYGSYYYKYAYTYARNGNGKAEKKGKRKKEKIID